MMHRLFVSMTVAGLLCGYMAMLYALMRIVVLIDHSYFLSLAMYMLDADVSKAILNFSVRVTSDSAVWLL
jgi:hypothetical protein